MIVCKSLENIIKILYVEYLAYINEMLLLQAEHPDYNSEIFWNQWHSVLISK